MDFDLTKEQEQLADTVQRFVAREYGFEARKAIRKSARSTAASASGRSRPCWR
jgi:hypothetical protein